MNKLAAFDVDNTLARGFYIEKFPEALYEEGNFDYKGLENLKGLFQDYKSEIIKDYSEFAPAVVRVYAQGIKGKRKEDVKKLGVRYINSHPNDVFAFAPGLVRLVKNKGYIPMVMSGSPEEVIIPLSKKLGIQDSFASSFEAEKGIYTGEVLQSLVAPGAKRINMLNYVFERSIDRKASAGFGDSDTDMEFLELLGYPVAVIPNEKLKEIVIKQVSEGRMWRIINKSDDKDIVLHKINLYLPGESEI